MTDNHFQAPKLSPYPGPRSVVVLDNCAIHHDEEVRRIVVGVCGNLKLMVVDSVFLLIFPLNRITVNLLAALLSGFQPY